MTRTPRISQTAHVWPSGRCRCLAREALAEWRAFVIDCALERAVRRPWLRFGVQALRANVRARRGERERAERMGRAALLSRAFQRLRQGAQAASAAALAAEARLRSRNSALLLRCTVLWLGQCRLRESREGVADLWRVKRIAGSALRKWRAHHVSETHTCNLPRSLCFAECSLGGRNPLDISSLWTAAFRRRWR